MADDNGYRGTAAPAIVTKAPAQAEIGATGLRVSSGRVDDEFHPRLRGRRAVRAWREMADNDPVVGAILLALDMLLREIGWNVEPAEETPAAIAERDFVQGCFDDLSVAWPQVLSSILTFLPYGWSFTEVVYKVRHGRKADPPSAFDDGRIGWRKVGFRSQESLVRWEFDDQGGLSAFVQRVERGDVTIPIERGLLFRTVARGNPEGRSILRNAYRPWWFKKHIEEVEGIGIERDLAGLPVALVPPAYLDDSATSEQKQVLEAVRDLVRDVKRDEQEGVIFPKEIDPETGADLWEFKLLSTGGSRQFDTDAIIARYDQRIAMTVLADFILLGHEKVGSYALGTSKVEMFTKALTAFADEVQTVFNRYALPRLMELNGVREELWPSLVHGPVQEVDLAKLGEFVQRGASAGAILPDRPLEDALRRAADLPPVDPDRSEV